MDLSSSGNLLAFAQLAAAAVTALATIALWHVTKTLTVETKRMADHQSSAHVVVDILPSPWASNHAEIVLQNTGSAPAFDVAVRLSPEIILDDNRKFPFASVSLIRPSQSLRSYFTDFGSILDKPLQASVSWATKPSGAERNSLEYTLNIPEMEGRGELGGDPTVKAAEALKTISEKLDKLTGHGQVQVQLYTHGDRLRIAEERAAVLEARRRKAEKEGK